MVAIRVTQQMMIDSSLANIEGNQSRLQTLENQITSGSQFAKPSDNPIGVARALNLSESISESQQYQKNIDQATSWLNTTDSALSALTSALGRVRELNVQAANGTLSATDRSAISAEITQLQQHVLDLSHAKYGPYYLFAGTASDKPGYTTPDPSTAGGYQGNTNQVIREVSPGTTVTVSTDANKTFDPVFTALQTFQSGLVANDTSQMQTSLDQLDSALTAINVSRGEVGAKVNRLSFLQQRQSSVEVNLTGLLSDTKDLDMAQALTNFSAAQNVYNASLKAGAQMIQPSLLDYLR
jgi:flagellar hook-associated protein 3 FlgL